MPQVVSGMNVYLGIDVGSVTTKFALLDEEGQLARSLYLRNRGQPVRSVQRGLKEIMGRVPPGAYISGVGTTGSARYLAGVIVGADVVKNEITSHAMAALHCVPDVQTVVDIGGQDSKIVIIRDGVVVDFGMNTICAAGTGSFLDHQASRLNVAIEHVGDVALRSRRPVPIAGRCTVFAESDMIHKQQMGYRLEDIAYGLCRAMVRNYLDNVGVGKEILSPVVFQGGVAFNRGIARALEEALGMTVIIPLHHEVSGALGAALLAQEEMADAAVRSRFRGLEMAEAELSTSSFQCKGCPSRCEITQVCRNGEVLGRWGARCDIWERTAS